MLASTFAALRPVGASSAASALAAPRVAAAAVAAGSARRYHQVVMDHFTQPRNVGSFDREEASVGTAIVGKASCGDVIKLQVKVDGDVIKDAKFKTFGCGSAIASSSLATEMIIGKRLDEAGQIRNSDISSHLKLPPVKIHCSVLAEEAVRAAIDDYKQKQQRQLEMATAAMAGSAGVSAHAAAA